MRPGEELTPEDIKQIGVSVAEYMHICELLEASAEQAARDAKS